MQNYVQPGNTLEVTVASPLVPTSGVPCRFGSLCGVAVLAEGEGGVSASSKTMVKFDGGVYDLSVTDTATGGIAIGDQLYFHDGNPPLIDNVSTSGYSFGVALEAIGSGLTATINVLHIPRHGLGTTPADASVTTAKIVAAQVTPAKLSAAGNSRVANVVLGAVAATTSFIAFIAPVAGSLNQCALVTKDAITANDTNYWTITLVDKGSNGSASNTIAEKTTKVTGGAGFASYDAWDIGTLDPTHKVLAAGDVVLLTLTKSASATAFAEALCMLEFLPS